MYVFRNIRVYTYMYDTAINDKRAREFGIKEENMGGLKGRNGKGDIIILKTKRNFKESSWSLFTRCQ